MNLIGHGFIAPTDILPEEYIFGAANALPLEVIQPDGDWRKYLPPEEKQARAFYDTYACTVYGTLTPIEILERKLFGEQSEYAERFVYIGTKTRPPGNNPHKIAEWIRKNGLIPEDRLPFTDLQQNLSEYASPNPLTADYTKEGKKWLTQKSFSHEWVATDKHDPKETQERLKVAVHMSPIAVSADAWQEQNGLYVKEQGQRDNHWTVLVAYEGDNPIIFDSYEPYFKRLMPFYDFTYAKRYKIENRPQRSWSLMNYLKELFK